MERKAEPPFDTQRGRERERKRADLQNQHIQPVN